MAEPKVLGIVLAGGEGKRLAPLTADRAKPAVPFGGNYRLIDFALSNLVNAGYCRSSCSRSTRATPRPPHRDDLAAVAAARQLRHAGAGADAARAALVRRLGRRDLPEPQPDQRRAAGLHHRVRRRPHLPHGPAADGRAAHRDRRGRDGGRHPRAARGGRPVRRDRDRRRRAARSARSARSRRTPPACRRPTRSSPRWATTSSPPRC